MPQAYVVELDIQPAQPTYAGTVEIEVDIREPVDIVWLHAEGLTIRRAELRQGRRTIAAAARTSGGYLGFELPERASPGPARIRLSFQGRLEDDRTDGIYRVAEPNGDHHVYTMFESHRARRAFPCFDEPRFKVPWTLRFVVSGSDIAVANGPVVTETRLDENRRRIEMAPTPPLPSYLVAFVIGPFEIIDSGTVGANAHPLRFIVPKGRTGGGELDHAKASTPRIVAALEEFFDIPYPYQKLEARAGAGAAMRTFIEQPGIPLVEMTVSCEDGAAAIGLRQSRYRSLSARATPGARWQIPVCVAYTTDRERSTHCTLLTEASGEMRLPNSTCPTHVVPNHDGVGYYVASLTGAAIASPRSMSLAEKKVTLDDRAMLVRGGRGSLPALLRDPPTATVEEDPELNAHYLDLLDYAHRHTSEALHARVATFIRATLGERARALGWRPADGERDAIRTLRAALVRLVGVEGDDAQLRAEARALVEAHLAGVQRVHPSMLWTALELAARSNDPALFDRLLEAARTTDESHWRRTYHAALGAFTAPALVERALALLIDGSTDLRDSRGLLALLFADHRTRARAYRFFEANFDSLAARMTSAYHEYYLVGITGSFCDRAHRYEVERFLTPRADRIEGGRRALANVLEEIELCIAQRAHHRPQLDAFFTAWMPDETGT